ncbi:AbfB domain-containing protein [Streptomyces sp. NBC_01262]|uniref:AbfB domain-containing protein n=1 Tax=Streptomyces sp. NBC_01262 TaxID=2903803 RepID=UPI002E315960|nr:AbfB domain-containing protein [Streptomyces sp. NBC_01262]
MAAEESNDPDPMGVRPYVTFTGEIAPRPNTHLVHASAPDSRELVLKPPFPPVPYVPRPGQVTPLPARAGGGRTRRLVAVALAAAGAAALALVAWGMTSGSESKGASRYVDIQGGPSQGNRGPLVSASAPSGRGSRSPSPSGTASASPSADSSPSGTNSAQGSASAKATATAGAGAGTGGTSSPTGSATTPQASAARSLESVNYPDRYLTVHSDGLGYLDKVKSTDSAQTRQNASFNLVTGLADPSCYSFMAEDGEFLRHKDFRIRLMADDGSALFEQDATFCPHNGSVSGSVSYTSYNYPGYYLRHRQFELWIDPYQDSSGFRDDSSFRLGASLG